MKYAYNVWHLPCLVILLSLIGGTLKAQGQIFQEKEVLSATEFSIPPSAAFDLLGVNPSFVSRSNTLRDIKVDWSFKSWRMTPNIAVQGQPIWEILYNRADAERYRKASPFMRTLSTLDLSIGTVTDDNFDRRIAGAARISLFRQKDPLIDPIVYQSAVDEYYEEQKELEKRIEQVRSSLSDTMDVFTLREIRGDIERLESLLGSLDRIYKERIQQRAADYMEEYWNAGGLDIAIGRAYAFSTDSANTLTSLQINRNTGFSIWANGNIPLGRKMMLSGLVRFLSYEEQVDFVAFDSAADLEIDTFQIFNNRLFSTGLNLRYGGAKYSFFLEALVERKMERSASTLIQGSSYVPSNPTQEILEESIEWLIVHPYIISFGGDWRISRNVVITYGLQATLTQTGGLHSFAPVAGISCLMR